MPVETQTYAVHFDREARTVRAEGPGLYVPLPHGGHIPAGETYAVRPVLEGRETYVNEDKGYQFGDSDWQTIEDYEPGEDDIGPLYRSLRKEYGGKVSRIYREPDNHQVGWVFSRREEYEDSGEHGRSREFYTRAVWVSLRIAWRADAPFDPIIAIDPPNLKGKP